MDLRLPGPLTPADREELKAFQEQIGGTPDGKYGTQSHGALFSGQPDDPGAPDWTPEKFSFFEFYVGLFLGLLFAAMVAVAS